MPRSDNITHLARVGLIAAPLLMGVALVATAWSTYAGVNDAAASEQTFQALIEDVVAALGADRKLAQTARHCGPAAVRAVDFRIINGVLCHHAELAVVVEEKPA